MYVSEVIDEKEWRAYIVPDDTIFNAPLGNSLRPLHSLVPITHSVTPDCIAQIFNSSSSDSLLAPLLMGWITETSLDGPQFLLKSCILLTQEEFLLLGRLRRSYFLWYLIYGNLHEEDVSGKGQTSWGVEHDWGIVWEKERRATKINPTWCSQHR